MKYSLKSKEFNKKRLSIFDKNQRRSRSRSTSLTPQKEKQYKIQRSIQNSYHINITPPSLNSSQIDKLQSLNSHKNSIRVQKNQESHQIFQSFAENQSRNNNSKNNNTFNKQVLKASQPIQINSTIVIRPQLNQRKQNYSNSNKAESFQICEEDNSSSRMNRFFAQSVFRGSDQSPHNKVVFQPVVRRSISQSPESLYPDYYYQKSSKIANQPNLIVEPKLNISKQYQYKPIVKRIVFEQRPQQIVLSTSLQHSSNANFQERENKKQNEEVNFLKKRIEEQNLQIQYLKNQKQILESNIQLKFSPKKIAYQTNQNTQHQQRINPEKYINIQVNDQQLDRNKIMQLSEILKANQIKLDYFQRKISNTNENIIKKFDFSLFKCQQQLIAIFSKKYFSFSEQLKQKIQLFQRKLQQFNHFDQKLDIFANTFRNISQNLRIAKLRQENIQLLIQNQYKTSDNFWNSQQPTKFLSNQFDISSIKKYEDNDLQQKDREDMYKLSKNIKAKNRLQSKSKQKNLEFQQFLDQKYQHLVFHRKQQPQISILKSKDRKKQNIQNKKQLSFSNFYERNQPSNNNKSTSEQIEQFSPFQANQMIKNKINKWNNVQITQQNAFHKHSHLSNTDFSYKKNKQHSFHYLNESPDELKKNYSFDQSSSKNFDFSSNSFDIQMRFKEAPKNDANSVKNDKHKQISFNSQTMFKKPFSGTLTQNDDISDSLQGQQHRIINILKHKNHQLPIECWLDELGCIRKKNQTYIFDQQGSVIITTSAAFKKLKQKKVFI